MDNRYQVMAKITGGTCTYNQDLRYKNVHVLRNVAKCQYNVHCTCRHRYTIIKMSVSPNLNIQSRLERLLDIIQCTYIHVHIYMNVHAENRSEDDMVK